MTQWLKCGRFDFAMGVGQRPLIMGILNLTPDSFSDGGQFLHLETALSHAEQMIGNGVDIIDIGGESSRPGALPVSLQEELDRVMPVLYSLRDCGKALSVDTHKPEVMRQALLAGADMINDIKAFSTAGAIDAVRDSDCGLCVMHMQRNPQVMQADPVYDDVVEDVLQFLLERAEALQDEGIDAGRLCLDPGFGFGKTLAHNLALLQNLENIGRRTGFPILAGLSRKSMIGELTGRMPAQRAAGSVAGALIAAGAGAAILRVHDVAETVDALKVWQAVRQIDETKESRIT